MKGLRAKLVLFVALLFLLISLLPLTVSHGATSWVIQTVDSLGDVGGYSSLALDENGYPCISYYDAEHKDLKYAFFEGDYTPPGAPVVSSSTHPDQDTYYSNNDPEFTWTIPADDSGIAGYSVTFGQNSFAMPDETIGTTDNSFSYSDVEDGVWYFDVRAVDNAGNWGDKGSYIIKIESTSTSPSPSPQPTPTPSPSSSPTPSPSPSSAPTPTPTPPPEETSVSLETVIVIIVVAVLAGIGIAVVLLKKKRIRLTHFS